MAVSKIPARIPAILLAGGLSFAACAVAGQAAADTLSIYSPAAPPNKMWSLNESVGAMLQECGVAPEVTSIPAALPNMVLDIKQLESVANHLPIMTTVDFYPAREGTGPEWHAYPDANPDMKFVAALYDVGVGFQVFDEAIKKPEDLRGAAIGVPRRPSSPRVLVEAILGDAWGVLDDVTLVDMPPNKVGEAIANGTISATSWNMLIQTPGGYRPMLGDLPGHWLSLSDEDIEKVHAASDIRIAPTVIEGPDSVRNASFKQGLVAWSSTPDAVVTGILECLSKRADPAVLVDWPGLEPGDLHPAAANFYAQTGN